MDLSKYIKEYISYTSEDLKQAREAISNLEKISVSQLVRLTGWGYARSKAVIVRLVVDGVLEGESETTWKVLDTHDC